MTGIQKAVWWTEYVLRHKNTNYLRSPAADITWWEYFMLDVLAFVLILFAILLYVSIKAFKLLHNAVYESSTKYKTL